MIHEWDVFTFHRITSHLVSSNFVRLARWVSRSADGFFYPIFPAVLIVLEVEGAQQYLHLLLAAFCLERLVYFMAKNSFRRKRPANILPGYCSQITASDEFSFPSGHTSAAFLMVTLLTICFGPWCALLYCWSVMVAASRVVLGVHFPTDTFVGAFMGSILAIVTSEVFL